MSNGKDTHLEVLSHHYSETFELLKADVAKRDRLFLYILIVIFALLLYMSAPTAMSTLLNTFVRSQLGDKSETDLIDVSFIGVILLLGLLSLSHTYFQTVLHVERQYNYVYQLEKQLSQHFDELAFIREGTFYKSHRRKFSGWTKAIYWWLFPMLFLLFNIIWLIFLWGRAQAPFAYKIVDTLISLSILISLAFYLLALIKNK
jgi:hypothetical protein